MPRTGRRREEHYSKARTPLEPHAGMASQAPCAPDKVLGMVVHRFDCGLRVCRCGVLNLEQAHAELPPAVQERLQRL